MKLSHELGKIFEDSLQNILTREEAEEDFMNQDDFNNAEARAEAMINAAITPVKKTLALAIATHEITKHEKVEFQAEVETLRAEITPEQEEIGALGWWGP